MNVFITIGGKGERMKSISPINKHLLYYESKRIIDSILEIFPKAKIIGDKKTNSRKETLEQIRFKEDCLIVDCDIIPIFDNDFILDLKEDTIFYFNSDKNKYGSLIIDNGIVIEASEKGNISKYKCSGLYYVKSMDKLLNEMKDDNSIASGMIGANTIKENKFIRLGDIEDYFEAL